MDEREFFYVITLQYQNPNGTGVTSATCSGVVGGFPTRRDAYERIVQQNREELGAASCVTLFFSLEPNDLGAQRSAD